jgi:succinate dehydrogenase / fumarate reductase flavoprotein subunit
MVAGPSAVRYAEGLTVRSDELPKGIFESETKRQEEINKRLLGSEGNENQYKLYTGMGDVMRENVTVIRHNDRLKATDEKLVELTDRFKGINIADRSRVANQGLVFARELQNMLVLARAITLGALRRDESRGAHYKPEFPGRDDANWLRTTRASYAPDGPVFDYEPVDVSLITPRERHYEVD